MMWDPSDTLNPAISEVRSADCIVIEEAQFFTGLRTFVQYAMTSYSKDIVVVGLDGDATQHPFGEILQCIPWATTVTKLCALCKRCKDGTVAPFTRKIRQTSSHQIDVGGSDKYESVCLKHLTNHVQ
jgi:thymidine kinase